MTETDYTPSDAEVEAGRAALEKLNYAPDQRPKSGSVEWRADRVRAFVVIKAAARVRAEEQRDGAKVVGEGG